MIIENDGYPYFTISELIGVGFTLRNIPEDQHKWLNEVLARQLQNTYDNGYKDAIKEVRKLTKPFKTLLDM